MSALLAVKVCNNELGVKDDFWLTHTVVQLLWYIIALLGGYKIINLLIEQEFSRCCMFAVDYVLYSFVLENVLKWRTDSDTNLTCL